MGASNAINIRWSKDRVLTEARRRTKSLLTDNSSKVQQMLAELMTESGWSEEEFIDALCHDVINNAAKKHS